MSDIAADVPQRRAAPGAAMVDYALILVLVAISAFSVLRITGITISNLICEVNAGLVGADGACGAAEEEPLSDPDDDEDDRLLFTDEFDDAGLGQWTNTGSWRQQDSAICSRADNNRFMLMYAPDSSGTDYTATANGVTMNNNGSFTLFFRSAGTSGDTYGVYYLNRNGQDYAYLVEWQRGAVVYPLLDTTTVPPQLRLGKTPRQMKVVVTGGDIAAYIDGVPILSAGDASYAAGGVGFGVTGGTVACVQDIRVEGRK